MGKHARKRLKTENPVAPLGSRVSSTDDANKDDEERRLESLLFGVPFVPSDKGHKTILTISDDEEEVPADGGAELENMLDTDLFYLDDGETSNVKKISELDIGFGATQFDESDEEVLSENEDRSPEVVEEDEGEAASSGPVAALKGQKAPAWTDPDDTTLRVSLASDTRLRKLRDAPSEDAVDGRDYERRLRRQYEKINPTPNWASNARNKLHPSKSKRRRSSASSGSEADDEDVVPDLLSSTGGILDTTIRSKTLPQGTLAIERLRDANQAAQSEGEIKAVQFHPSPKVPVLMTASADRRVRLFNIDGHSNPHLQTLHIPSLPVTAAQFHPTGSSVLLTGSRPFYYTYDLQSGTTQRSPRGLWGTTFNNSNPQTEDSSMEICAFNPTGEVLAVAGRRGYIHLVDWKSGAGQVVGSLKMNAGVKSLWWTRGSSGEGRELMSLSDNAEVYVWDISGRKCTRRWQDHGGFGSCVIDGDRAGKYVAIGANSGFVNVYGSDGASSGSDRPQPLKTIGNLTTSISTLRFNHDSQLLAIASKSKKDHMRLIHLPSLTAFANWPTSNTPLGHVASVDFSPGSEYIAMGNNRGRVLLYHLRDFSPN